MKKLLIVMLLLFLSSTVIYSQKSEGSIKNFLNEESISLKDIVLNPQNKEAEYLSSEEQANFQYLSIREQIKLQEAFNKEEKPETLKKEGEISYEIDKTDKAIILSPDADDLPEILIYFKKDKMKLGEHSLQFDKELEATDSDNIFNSPWKGYRWKKGHSKVVIGKLEKDGRYFIHLNNLTTGNKRDRILVE
ncbi:hypothetical protein [Salegentibacter chungangensis]|uniref:Metalloprotease n=1 Tax=Salegentibacter chungangensis TaxID=1335724 RepID=A0ABW3NQG8_9FLAO